MQPQITVRVVNVHGTSMCPHKYFASIPADMFGCYFGER
jgi:hypothetical protein